MFTHSKFIFALTASLALVLLLAACSPAATAPVSAPATAAPTQAATYSEPFAYCASVGTVDAPDARYTGPALPDSILAGLRKTSGASPDMPLDVLKNGSFWRCMDGKVYACFVGANLPCESKANTDKTPISGETDFCKANASAEVIPAAVTGHDTVYEWRCQNGTPQVVKQVFQVDARGYISEIWYAINPQP